MRIDKRTESTEVGVRHIRQARHDVSNTLPGQPPHGGLDHGDRLRARDRPMEIQDNYIAELTFLDSHDLSSSLAGFNETTANT
jgi:hypothetical protein